jgi:hypothetical protein
VIRGEFANKGQTDWAVLCSKEGKSSILVFWGKPTACASEFASSDDDGFLQGGRNDQMVYSRGIRAVSEKDLSGFADPDLGQMKPSGPVKRVAFRHQGIEDLFLGKASTVFYCIAGKWKVIGGAD